MVAMVAVGIASVRTTNCWLLNDTPRLAIIPQMSTGKPKFFSSTFKTTMRVSRHGLVVNRSPSANNATPPAACPNSVKFVSQALSNRNPAKFKRKALIGAHTTGCRLARHSFCQPARQRCSGVEPPASVNSNTLTGTCTKFMYRPPNATNKTLILPKTTSKTETPMNGIEGLAITSARNVPVSSC